MNILITGAAGFLGRSAVDVALARGHDVRAMVRPANTFGKGRRIDSPRLEVARCDLRSKGDIANAMVGIDAILHMAAVKSGDFHAQMAGTVVATENLLEAMVASGTRRLVLVSSFSVYDLLRTWSHGLIDEQSKLDECPLDRDEYAQTKLIQETLAREYAARHGIKLTVVRPGVIFGPHNHWNGWVGMELSSRLWLRFGAWARIPTTYVEHCAEAIVMCAESTAAVGRTYNIIDDDLPTQRKYIRELQRRMSPRPRVIPISWTVMRLLARAVWLTNRIVFRGRAKVPSILHPARLHARAKPMRYSNRALRETIGWKPRYSFAEAMEVSFQAQNATVEPLAAETIESAMRNAEPCVSHT